MPIFEYVCKECGQRFEKIVLGGQTSVECPQCSGAETEKMISSFAVSAGNGKSAAAEPGPCACGAPQKGMCQS
ncbi:MAG TPA: zinc ribbon domain-containing protein [Acidobacteriota bacterium]|nr:zinc ribbon domain-containing protein [Acidobacteriota bacterium]